MNNADADGIIALGQLAGGVTSVSARLGTGAEREWKLPFVQPPLPSSLCIAADRQDEVIVVTLLK